MLSNGLLHVEEDMTSERSGEGRAAMVLGFVLAAFGVGMLIDRTDLIDMPGVSRLWPVVLIAVGLTHFMGPQADIRHGAGLIATGFWMLVVTLTRVEFRDTWPMLLVIFGLSTIWRSLPIATGSATNKENTDVR
jgi:hypothetical protein